jgi:hypothetical protein
VRGSSYRGSSSHCCAGSRLSRCGSFTKGELLREVWGYEADASTRTLDAHACRLRRKLEQAGAHGHVVNRRGVGYRLVDRGSEPDADSGAGALVALRRVGTAA